VRHLLYECARWAIERTQILQAAGVRWVDMSYMLGGWFNERLDGPCKNWKPNTTAIKATIAFVKTTPSTALKPQPIK